ncbi:MAG: GMC oxidoreductase [Terriglobales bacterium]
MAEPYDVIVVGSGASGGWACKRLAEAGLKVALVDAGRPQADANFSEHKPAYELPYRNQALYLLEKTQPVQMQCYACDEFSHNWYCNDLDEPYTTDTDMPFSWQGRVRMVGGRTNCWGRVSLRLSHYDLKAASYDGYGVDWPLDYPDLAPYYDIVEEYVGITGMLEGLPQLPDGKFQPPMGLSCAEMQFRTQVKEKLDRTMTLARCANLTRGINGRAPCHYCGPCHRGCVTHSYFNSSFTTVADALRTGRCTLIPNAMAYRVEMEKDRERANGVYYIDRVTREGHFIAARAVVLCAQAQESARILLNSHTPRHPNGLANSSGAVGRYFMDNVMGGGAAGEMDGVNEKPTLSGPKRPADIYVVRFRNLPFAPATRNDKFIRGYGYEGGGGVDYNWSARGFGGYFKKAVFDPQVSIGFGGFGESLARWENHVSIDPDVVDTFGIPVLRFHVKYGENEFAMVKDMAEAMGEMLEAAGAKNIQTYARPTAPGWAIHEVGVARMGNDPKTSVLNQFEQSHDVPNLFVMDGSAFPSSGCQNVTLTIMALCVRSCDYLAQQMKRGEI